MSLVNPLQENWRSSTSPKLSTSSPFCHSSAVITCNSEESQITFKIRTVKVNISLTKTAFFGWVQICDVVEIVMTTIPFPFLCKTKFLISGSNEKKKK